LYSALFKTIYSNHGYPQIQVNSVLACLPLPWIEGQLSLGLPALRLLCLARVTAKSHSTAGTCIATLSKPNHSVQSTAVAVARPAGNREDWTGAHAPQRARPLSWTQSP
jgi:hypothetical protein